jgi:PhnB protein
MLAFGGNMMRLADTLNGKLQGMYDNMHLEMEMEDDEKMRNIFNKLSVSGNVLIPMGLQFWGGVFGMVEDKFGVFWRFNHDVIPDRQ